MLTLDFDVVILRRGGIRKGVEAAAQDTAIRCAYASTIGVVIVIIGVVAMTVINKVMKVNEEDY